LRTHDRKRATAAKAAFRGAQRRNHSGPGAVEDVDARRLTLQERSGEAQIFLTRLVSAGNVSAGFASALHVNIYLLALAMMVSNKYLDVGVTLQLAIWGTFVLQLFFTLFSSYKHYAIANGDVLPGAVLISVLQAVETRHAS